MLSEILSAIGIGQNHARSVSEKYSEASKLNAQFELNLNNAINLVRSEQVHLRHRISAISEHPEEEHFLLSQLDPLLDRLVSETEVGLATVENTRKAIRNSSRFSSIRKWDECLSILHRQVAASKHQIERIELTLGQLHRVLDNAEEEAPQLGNHEAFIAPIRDSEW